MLKCPNCSKVLKIIDKSYKCENNHSFDISKYGHINLLLSNQKNSKAPGDNKEMVIARKGFLDENYYSGISDRVNQIVNSYIIENSTLNKEESEVNILDTGCGEGYYTERLRKSLEEKNIKKFNIYGLDISKEAIILASKTYKKIDWMVASATHLPFLDESLDFIICMFAKIVPEEKMRCLKKGGKLIVVSTGENHLQELKQVVYETVKKDFYLPALDESLKIFKHLETIKNSYTTKIETKDHIENLFNMTPYRWRSPEAGVKKLFELDSLEVTVEVSIDIFEKN